MSYAQFLDAIRAPGNGLADIYSVPIGAIPYKEGLDGPTRAESCSRRKAMEWRMGSGSQTSRPPFASRPPGQTHGSRQRWPRASD